VVEYLRVFSHVGFFYAVALSGRSRDTVSEVAVIATHD
jgi:hypothetical protein